jgi:PAS domain S-box-containing protein
MQAINSADIPVLIVDDYNVVQYASKTAAKRLEYISEEIVGRNLMSFVAGQDKHQLEANLHRMLRNCTDRLTGDVEFISKSGAVTKQTLVMNRFVYDKKWYASCFMIPEYLDCRLKATTNER